MLDFDYNKIIVSPNWYVCMWTRWFWSCFTFAHAWYRFAWNFLSIHRFDANTVRLCSHLLRTLVIIIIIIGVLFHCGFDCIEPYVVWTAKLSWLICIKPYRVALNHTVGASIKKQCFIYFLHHFFTGKNT